MYHQIPSAFFVIKFTGAFEACSDRLDLQSLTAACEYDLCATLPDESLLCDHLDNLAGICRKEGIVIGDWRAEVPQCRESLSDL